MKRNVYSSAVLTGVRPLCTKILPSTISGTRKLEILGYSTVEIATRFDTIPECDGQTDGRICRSIYTACKASFAARCKKRTTTLLDRQTDRRTYRQFRKILHKIKQMARWLRQNYSQLTRSHCMKISQNVLLIAHLVNSVSKNSLHSLIISILEVLNSCTILWFFVKSRDCISV